MLVYVDNNATTCVAREVFEAMVPFLTDQYGNPSSAHPFGGSASKIIVSSRENLAELLGCDADELIFTSCGTESDSTAILSALATQQNRRKIVTTAVEHPAVLKVCKRLQQQGYRVEYLPVDKHGRLNLADVDNAIDDETALVSVMWANNEIGNVYPVEMIAEIAHARGALFHTDAVQAVGKVKIDLSSTTIDFLSLSGHKLHAPKGVGALYVRRFTPYWSFLTGGHQERGQRAGTENVASIAGLGMAALLARENMEVEQTYVKGLRDRMEAGLLATCPDPAVNGDVEHRLPNTSSICFKYIEGEAILLRLYQAGGICASSGSACTSGSLEPSHVLRAMGLDYRMLHGSIRFSFSRYNTEQDVDVILEKTPPIIKALREMSPFGH
ncbi:MAG: cysteine desulfurase NifS [Lentisphaerae bacterium]|jgi:cysteine desulfurase|nr:cysteine desulfurase NifS [Lentisphaerota bacterium]